LTDYLINNHDAVETILNDIGFTHIRYNADKQEIRFSRREGGNPTAVVLYLNTMSFYCFSTNKYGNIYTLVMQRKNYSFPMSLQYVANELGLSQQQLDLKTHLPFGGFYKDIIAYNNEPECHLKTYDKFILKPYLHKYNMMFFNDGIDFQTQEEYQIGYDLYSGRITFPIWTLNGELCGIMGRLNDTNCSKENRWLPIIPCQRSLTLSAYHRNYQYIQQKGLAIICESDKAPAQMHNFGCNLGLATSGHHISFTQAKYLKGLLIPRLVVAYDEGLEEEQIREEAKTLITNTPIYRNHVGYIWDNENEILKKGLKQSPSDVGKEKFAYLMKKKVKWLS
jgi:DNA primase